jgi:hypothetical protein
MKMHDGMHDEMHDGICNTVPMSINMLHSVNLIWSIQLN